MYDATVMYILIVVAIGHFGWLHYKRCFILRYFRDYPKTLLLHYEQEVTSDISELARASRTIQSKNRLIFCEILF